MTKNSKRQLFQLLSMILIVIIFAVLIIGVWMQWKEFSWLERLLLSEAESAYVLDQRSSLILDKAYWSFWLTSIQSLGLLVFIGLIAWRSHLQTLQNKTLRETSMELEQARTEAEKANRAKGDFLATISHEVRTPFQGLMGMLNILEVKLTNDEQREYLHNAYESAEHLLGLINDVLDVSTLDSGTLRLAIRPMHVQSILSEVEGLMQIPAKNKGLTLTVKIDETTGAVPEWLMADPRRVRQIMFNLISNAIKFTAQGSVEAHFKCIPNVDDYYLITVRDTGMGMDQETLDQLFTRFYQADTSVQRHVGGSGLGLEISKSLAQMMGGDITVTSEPMEGTLFIVMLHLPHIGINVVADASEKLSIDLKNLPHRQLRILVADDHPINLKFMDLLLKRMDHIPTTCIDGEAAYQIAQLQDFDVILLDYHMPIRDGLNAARAIQELNPDSSSAAKIILITADALNKTRQEAALAGVDVVILKPVFEEDLLRAFKLCGLLDTPFDEVQIKAPSISLEKTKTKPYTEEQTREDSTLPLLEAEHWESVIESMGRDELAEMINTLFSEEGTTQQLLSFLEKTDRQDTDIEKIAYYAHQLKGVSLLMGFTQLASLSGHFEQRTKNKLPINNNDGSITEIRNCIASTKAIASESLQS